MSMSPTYRLVALRHWQGSGGVRIVVEKWLGDWQYRWMLTNAVAANRALHGLALGDAFGETWFFRPAAQMQWLQRERVMPKGPWRWTDDTAMAISLYRMLVTRGEVVQDELAALFAAAYEADPHRNYGPSMHGVLQAIFDGEPWSEVTSRQFDGQGSWGNGAAMRVAPLGAWFAADVEVVVRQAELSAAVTHAHPEATAGAIAAAVATSLAVQGIPADDLIDHALAHTPDSEVASRLRLAARQPFSAEPQEGGRRSGLRAADFGSGHCSVCDLVRGTASGRLARGVVGHRIGRWRRRHHVCHCRWDCCCPNRPCPDIDGMAGGVRAPAGLGDAAAGRRSIDDGDRLLRRLADSPDGVTQVLGGAAIGLGERGRTSWSCRVDREAAATVYGGDGNDDSPDRGGRCRQHDAGSCGVRVLQ
jgi:ADP-ribosylglycohydrolase